MDHKDKILLQVTFTDPGLAQGWLHQEQEGIMAGMLW